MSILVTGGAGFIGSHVVRHSRGDDELIVVDDLRTGNQARLDGARLVRIDLASADASDALVKTIKEHKVTHVVHLAAEKQVGESVKNPIFYYRQNVGGLANLLDAMERTSVGKLVFSSSAAAYGAPPEIRDGVVTETATATPLSPYGETKLIGEWMCRNAERAWGLSWAGLRYFNVAGAGAPELGDTAVLNLIPIVFSRLAAGERPLVYGDDYPTPDGTCVRDYVHVSDLADAHIAVLRSLDRSERRHRVYNVGTGVGSSVLEVLQVIADVTGRDTTPEVVGRRPGDPAVLTADVSRLALDLGWTARRSLREMVESAWQAWQLHDQ